MVYIGIIHHGHSNDSNHHPTHGYTSAHLAATASHHVQLTITLVPMTTMGIAEANAIPSRMVLTRALQKVSEAARGRAPAYQKLEFSLPAKVFVRMLVHWVAPACGR